ncbi:MAG: SDR family oxidoreductase [Arenimonas sp.]
MTAASTMRILVTGASRGLGLEFVQQALSRGDTVLAGARNPKPNDALQELAGAYPGRLHVLALDVADSASFRKFAEAAADRVPALDLLINNAGILARDEAFGQLLAKPFIDAFTTNALGPLLLTQALTPLLQRGIDARVLNLSSDLGSMTHTTGFYLPSYDVSKAALNMVGVLLGHALAEHRVRVLNMHPGWVRTDMGGDGAQLDASDVVESIFKTLAALPPATTGVFIDRDGAPLPW